MLSDEKKKEETVLAQGTKRRIRVIANNLYNANLPNYLVTEEGKEKTEYITAYGITGTSAWSLNQGELYDHLCGYEREAAWIETDGTLLVKGMERYAIEPEPAAS